MAFVVTRRSKELGLRMALGAEPGGVIWLVMKEVLVLLGIGLAIPLAGSDRARQLTSPLSRTAFEAHDPVHCGRHDRDAVALVSAAAGLVLARRASRNRHPILALRYE